ncbi:MAG: hypothetical protein AAB091_05935, partial [Elusimicrobiota bacterium]
MMLNLAKSPEFLVRFFWKPPSRFAGRLFSEIKDRWRSLVSRAGFIASPAKAKPEISNLDLQGKRLMIIGSVKGREFVFEHLKSAGARVVLVDNPGSSFASLADEFIQAPMTDPSGEYQEARKIVLDYVRLRPIDGQPWVFFDSNVLLGAKLRHDLGFITDNELDSLLIARDKIKTREWMVKKGFLTPRFVRIEPEGNLVKKIKAAVEHTGLPAVFKVPSAAAGRGYRLVNSYEEALEAYAILRRDISNFSSEEVRKYYPEFVNGMGPVVIEEYIGKKDEYRALGSDELDADVIWQGGKTRGI